MRALRATLALGIAIGASAGCRPDDTGAVLLHVTDSVGLSPAMTTYSSSEAAVSFSPDGPVLLSATSNQGLLRVLLPGPLVTGATVALPAGEERVHFEIGGAAWGNQGGNVFVISADPAIIRLLGVPMAANGGGALGTFVFDGDGTFRGPAAFQ